jgi:hypothetical protein
MASLIMDAWRGVTETVYGHRELLLSNKFAIYMTIGYMIFVGVASLFMRNRAPFDLRRALGLHNLFLCVLSLMMALGGIWEVYSAFTTHPFMHVYCSNVRSPDRLPLAGAAFFWTCLFYLSKYWEFLDTAFIILRKKPLLFLHVFVRSLSKSISQYCALHRLFSQRRTASFAPPASCMLPDRRIIMEVYLSHGVVLSGCTRRR